jgi:bacteriocin-like protein
MQRKPEAKITEVATELTQDELDKVSGGKPNQFLKIDGIKGESQDDKHKDE